MYTKHRFYRHFIFQKLGRVSVYERSLINYMSGAAPVYL